ncbi:hypothetical protein K440DRAFT_640333 [Wilcoxina mikolae CBS 423.85]|nr:hypothetical protein K440DRAFT_640333 [Wilcoxina mikolae CBS 423.85]
MHLLRTPAANIEHTLGFKVLDCADTKDTIHSFSRTQPDKLKSVLLLANSREQSAYQKNTLPKILQRGTDNAGIYVGETTILSTVVRIIPTCNQKKNIRIGPMSAGDHDQHRRTTHEKDIMRTCILHKDTLIERVRPHCRKILILDQKFVSGFKA